SVPLPPASRVTRDIGAHLVASGVTLPVNLSAKVSSTTPISVERPLYFRTGLAGGVDGATTVVGATSPSLSLGFAEGTVRPGFVEFLTIQNPGPQAGVATLDFQAADDAGAAINVPPLQVAV